MPHLSSHHLPVWVVICHRVLLLVLDDFNDWYSHLGYSSLAAHSHASGLRRSKEPDNNLAKRQKKEMQYGGPKTIMPHTSTDSSRETRKKYMEAITKQKNTMTPPMCITSEKPLQVNKTIEKYLLIIHLGPANTSSSTLRNEAYMSR